MSNRITFTGKLGIQQRVVPNYRIDFFDLLAESCSGGLSIFAGEVPHDESIPTSIDLKVAKYWRAKNYHFRDVQSPYYLLWQAGILNWLEAWNPDALIVEANPRYLSTMRAMRRMHSKEKPVIGWGLGVPELGSQKKVIGRLSSGLRNLQRTRMLRRLDGLIAYSHKGAEQYRSMITPEIPVYVASNSAARRPLGPAPTRDKKGFDTPVVLFVGRIQARKRLDNLIQACSKLPEHLKPRLWIVGDGPELEKLSNLSSKVHLNTEFMGHKIGLELAEIFKQADLFVLPGTGGLAVQEAMSYALPVIVAEGDGTQEDLVSAENGWLIPPNDEESLRSTLEIALSNLSRLRRMGENSYQKIQDENNIEQMVNKFIAALNEIPLSGRT